MRRAGLSPFGALVHAECLTEDAYPEPPVPVHICFCFLRTQFHRPSGGRLRVFAVIILTSLLIAAGARAAPAQSCDLAAKDVRLAGTGCAAAWFDANVRLNEFQAVGTSESYKLQPSKQMMSLIKMGSSGDAQALDYDQPPIAAQLAAGARSLEFDVAYDPKGGLYKYPAGASMAGELVGDD
jgi:hypothetical protein